MPGLEIHIDDAVAELLKVYRPLPTLSGLRFQELIRKNPEHAQKFSSLALDERISQMIISHNGMGQELMFDYLMDEAKVNSAQNPADCLPRFEAFDNYLKTLVEPNGHSARRFSVTEVDYLVWAYKISRYFLDSSSSRSFHALLEIGKAFGHGI